MCTKKIVGFLIIAACAMNGLASLTRADADREGDAAEEKAQIVQAKPEQPRYTYVMAGLGYDERGSGCVNSLPVLWPSLKWAAGNAYDGSFCFAIDGEYAYLNARSCPGVTRYNLRTGKANPLGGFVHGDYVNDLCLEGETLYVSGGNNQGQNQQAFYRALSTVDGKKKWEFSEKEAAITHFVITSRDRIVALLCKQPPRMPITLEIVCLKKSDGAILWKKASDAESLLIQCGELVIGLKSKGYLALKIENGETAWEMPYKFPNDFTRSDGERIFIPEGRGGIAAYDGKTGKLLWKIEYGYAFTLFADKGRILTAKPSDDNQSCNSVWIDSRSGKELAKLNSKFPPIQVVGNWGYAIDAFVDPVTKGPPFLGVLYAFNIETGETRILIDAREKTSPINPNYPFGGYYPAIDGYLIVPPRLRSGKTEWACFEDMRFHPDAARLIFGVRPEALDEKAKEHILNLIEKLGETEYAQRAEARKELESLMDLPEEQLRLAANEHKDAAVRASADEMLKKVEHWKILRKYLDDFNCRRDPLYFTALVRHTADPKIQEKAIERLKKITGQDFGLKPSENWAKDQKEASDKYDAWWHENRDKLKWADEEDRYLPAAEK